MDASSLNLLQRVIALGARSLLQYITDSSPWATERTHEALTDIFAMARQERSEVGSLIRYQLKHHISPGPLESYPAHFTLMNFVTVEYLLPKLADDASAQIAEIEKSLNAVEDEEVRSLIVSYVQMKQHHLQRLQELSKTYQETAVA